MLIGAPRPVGERGLLVEVADNRSAHDLALYVRRELGDAVEDVVPGHSTVLIVGRSRRVTPDLLGGWRPPGDDASPDRVERSIAVRYDGADLDDVAAACGMSPEELVARHLEPVYTVAFYGFAPGFAYLVGGDPRLRPARLPSPRPSVSAGTVALAGEYCAVYPRDSPGGWRLIGSTDPRVFEVGDELPSPGERVRFLRR